MLVIDAPVSPSALVSFIIAHCTHPSTLIVGATSDQFVQQWAEDEHQRSEGDRPDKTTLLEVAVARHIRVVFVPTVAHLRGVLAAFDPSASRVPAPPSSAAQPTAARRSKLIIYNLLRLHRETSEWSAQGLGTTAAVLVEAGWRTGMDVVVAEGRGGEGHEDSAWSERVSVLSAGPRRQLEKAGYPPRTERIRGVFERWFAFEAELGAAQDEGMGEAGHVIEGAAEAAEAAEAEVAAVAKGTEAEAAETAADTQQEAAAETTAAPAADAQPASQPCIRTFVKDSEDEDDEDDLSDDY